MLDPRIEAIRDEYGLSKSDFWQIPQNKQWVCKHSALEVVSVKAGIVWTPPQIIEANGAAGVAAMVVTGSMGERTEWATGEASPKNCKNAYPWAMAEKRAKDRVILKLVGLHGLVYSEEEADDFKGAPALTAPSHEAQAEAQEVPEAPKLLSKADARKLEQEMRDEIAACSTVEQLQVLWTSQAFQGELKRLPRDWLASLIEFRDETKAALMDAPPQHPKGYVEPSFPDIPAETRQAAEMIRV